MKKIIGLACAAFLVCATAVCAAPFPAKNIKVIVPFAPGGGVDVTIRMMADTAPKHLNRQRLVIENMPGGGAVIGITAASRAAPDGYTLLAYTPLAVSSAITKKTSYTATSFIPIALYCLDPTIMVVRGDSPVKGLKDFISTASARPFSINTSGHSSTQHIGGMMMEKHFGLKFNYVHSTSGGLQIAQLLGGHVDAALMSLGEVSSYLKDGSLRAVGLMSDADYPGLPVMERFSSLGLTMKGGAGLEWGSLRGIAAPAGTPPDVVETLSTAFSGIINDPEFVARMTKAGFPLVFMNSADFSAYMVSVTQVLTEMLAGTPPL